jgi:hypothetical protein
MFSNENSNFCQSFHRIRDSLLHFFIIHCFELDDFKIAPFYLDAIERNKVFLDLQNKPIVTKNKYMGTIQTQLWILKYRRAFLYNLDTSK